MVLPKFCMPADVTVVVPLMYEGAPMVVGATPNFELTSSVSPLTDP